MTQKFYQKYNIKIESFDSETNESYIVKFSRVLNEIFFITVMSHILRQLATSTFFMIHLNMQRESWQHYFLEAPCKLLKKLSL